MKTTFVTALILLFAAFPAASQDIDDDAMEMQRCIWRCLANSNGADDPVYSACVGRMCSDDRPVVKKTKQSKAKRYAKRSAKAKAHARSPRARDTIVLRVRPVYVD